MMKKYAIAINICVLLLASVSMYGKWDDYYWESMKIIPDKYKDAYWYELYFLPDNPNCGFVCGDNGAFAKTTDGGLTWHASTILPGFHAECVYFANESVGYVSGVGHIFKTTNGGASWQNISPRMSPYDEPMIWGHYIIGADNVWLMAGNCSGKQVFFKSTNGGQSWTYASQNLHNSSLSDVIMYDKDGLGYAISSGKIWTTSNGGSSWRFFADTPEFTWYSTYNNISTRTQFNWHEDLQLYNKSIVIPVSATCSGSFIPEGGMAFSTNNGKNWNTFKTKASMFGSFILGDSIGWGCGVNRELYYTLNAGKSWTAFTCGIPAGKDLDDLWFIDDTTGFVCGRGIYKLAKKKTTLGIASEIMPCDSVMLSAIHDFNDYSWYKINGKDTVCIDFGREITVADSGYYIVEGFDIECYSVVSEPVKVASRNQLKINIVTDKDSYCPGDTAKVWFEPKELIKDFLWQEFNLRTDTISIIESGSYSLSYTDTNNCQKLINFNIFFNYLPEPQLEAISDMLLCVGDTAVIRITNHADYGGNAEIFWYNNDSIIAGNVPEILVTKDGNYHVYILLNKTCEAYSDTIPIVMKDEVNVLSFEENDTPFFIDSVRYSQLSCRNFKITNSSPNNIILNNIIFNQKIAFTAPMDQFPVTIAANSTKNILLCYSPTDLQEERDTILIIDNCSIHAVGISGFGLGNRDTATLSCDVPIAITTKEIVQKKIFISDQPAPNPADLLTKIHYSIAKNENYRINVAVTDFLGRQVPVAYSNDITHTYADEADSIISGELTLNTENLMQGIYFIQLSYCNINHIFKLLVR